MKRGIYYGGEQIPRSLALTTPRRKLWAAFNVIEFASVTSSKMRYGAKLLDVTRARPDWRISIASGQCRRYDCRIITRMTGGLTSNKLLLDVCCVDVIYLLYYP